MKTLALRRNLTVGLIFLLVGAFGLLGMAQATTIYVDDDNTAGPWDGTLEHPYQHIQDGVDGASHRDTVYVFNGTYYENVVVGKTISLIGENRDSTVIDGGWNDDDGVDVGADSLNIAGFTIQNCGGGLYAGIRQYWNYCNTFSGNNFRDNQVGIHLRYSSNVTISGNNFTNHVDAILSLSADHTVISGNTMADNYYHAIELSGSSGNVVLGNTITSNLADIILAHQCNDTIINNATTHGIEFAMDIDSLHFWNTHTVENNDVGGKPIYYYKNDSTGITVPSDAGQVILANCSNFIIESLNLSNVWRAIQLGYSSHNTIRNNTLTDNTFGIVLGQYSCFNNTIYHNNFIDNAQGACDYDGSNLWDDGYPSGGNYWSDFDEPDEGAYDNNGDGIVDSSYVGPCGYGEDRYPLMTPWDGTPPTPICGDASGNGLVDVGDITYLINYLFLGTSGPWPVECVGNANCDASADIGDVIFLIGYTFSGSSPPGDCCCSGWEK